MKEKAYTERYCIYKPTAGVKKSKVIKDEEEPLNSFADKTSLVGQLAKLEKGHYKKYVNNEVSCGDEEPKTMMEENLLKEGEDQHKSFLNDSWVGDDVMGMGFGEEGNAW